MSDGSSSAAKTFVPADGWTIASFRLIPRIETYPWVVSFAQTPVGRLILLALVGAGLWASGQAWVPLTLCLAIVTFVPVKRRLLLTLCTLAFTFLIPWFYGRISISILIAIAQVFVLAGILFWSAAQWPHSFYGRRPLVFLFCLFWVILLWGVALPASAKASRLIWQFVFVFGNYIWFIGFSLSDAKSPGHDDFGRQVGAYMPFWGSSNTPFPKGSAYLRQIEAQNSEQLAITQLKGLKLLAWSLILLLALRFTIVAVHDHLKVLTFPEALSLSASRVPLPWYTCWEALLYSFFTSLMSLSIVGHRFIACCRMAGFNALRNTYRPLSAVTVAQFFNRYYFYFKELLLEFFFYPTFLRYFKKNKNLRLAVAIFAAAGFGNALYHFMLSPDFIRKLGLWKALVTFQVYLFYCVLLSIGLTVSNLRKRRARRDGFFLTQLLPSISVVLFYCLLDVFGSTERNYPLIEHCRFFAHLFSINF